MNSLKKMFYNKKTHKKEDLGKTKYIINPNQVGWTSRSTTSVKLPGQTYVTVFLGVKMLDMDINSHLTLSYSINVPSHILRI